MKLLEKLSNVFKKSSSDEDASPRGSISDRAMLTFEHTGEVIRAENILRDNGYSVEVKGPPPGLRSGCDMILVINVLYQMPILELLQDASLPPLQVLPVASEMLEPVSLYHTQDFGQWLMVRAANMKITVEKESGRIVNISGGGCPDVPYLAHTLIGLTIEEAQEPRHIGQTLCCYSLQKAFTEARRLLLCG